MALMHRIAGNKRTTGLVLVAVGWLVWPAAPAFACSHPGIVSIAAFDFGLQTSEPSTPQFQRPTKANGPHNPFDPLGPCQGPQCDGTPDRPDRPLTSSSTTNVRDTSLACIPGPAREPAPSTDAWVLIDIPSPIQFHASIFHPPRG
ncbi:MAG: hypothetical protein L0Y71_15685 [Gemmataceae bacterium]|nr:hypothetical protein [Gemmataceae bacterium]